LEKFFDIFSTIKIEDDDINKKFISSDYLIKVMKSKLGEVITKEEADMMIKEADVDNDGLVSFNGKKILFTENRMFTILSFNFCLRSVRVVLRRILRSFKET
jgi:Ca2+-binding EF-hand superfamily protein